MTDWTSTPHNALLLAQATTAPATHAATAVPAAEAPESLAHTQWVFFGYAMVATIILVVLTIAATRRMRVIPVGLQNAFELVVETLNGLPEMVMGPRGRQYVPFIGTFFLYIFAVNVSGLIPGFKAGTASLSITVGLALTAFVAVQYFGFRAHGLKYLLHFFGPMPMTSIPAVLLGLVLLPLELLSEFIRPVSLSFRLYGNIFGEEQVIQALATKLGAAGPFAAVLILPLQVLTCVLQALVFSLLVTIYIALATEKHDEHEHAETAEASA